jgi:hypothetical protein
LPFLSYICIFFDLNFSGRQNQKPKAEDNNVCTQRGELENREKQNADFGDWEWGWVFTVYCLSPRLAGVCLEGIGTKMQ